MAAQLSAAPGAGAPRMHLRVGGSASNGLIYVPNGVPGRGPGGSTVVTDASLKALNDFAVRAGLQVTFCFQVSARVRRVEGASVRGCAWSSTMDVCVVVCE